MDPGTAVGSPVAALYVPRYRHQGIPATSHGGTGIGQWRPTPPANAAGFGPWVPFVKPFTLPTADYFRFKPQPELTSEQYTIDYNEVKEKGWPSCDTSGANNVTSATMETLRLFFGTNKFVFSVSSVPANKSREYTRFSDVQDHVVDVRVLQGIHFRFADEMGRKQGERVAMWVFQNFLKPVQPK
jgi:hypothetical protein